MTNIFETIETNRLDNKNILELLNNTKLLISDIDYTVTDFGSGNTEGAKMIRSIMSEEFTNEFSNLFDLILRGHRNLDLLNESERLYFDQIMQRISKDFESKFWSREVYCILVSEKLGLNLSPKKITEIVDIYWKGISENSDYYNDAVNFMSEVMKLKIPIIWMTGSDSRVQAIQNNGVLDIFYDPTISKDKKMERLTKLQHNFGGQIEIGDPIDKPNPLFYDKFLNKIIDIEMKNILVTGDSYINDLEYLKSKGCKTVLIKR